MSTICFKDVSFSYSASFDAAPHGTAIPQPNTISQLSHLFKPGSATLLTGPSGCGKSTVLKMINGLIPHIIPGELSGQVTVAGLDAANSSLSQLGNATATVFQNPRNQFFATTVREELAFARQQAGEPRDLILEKVKEVADRLRIANWLDRSLHQMSGGELQRVACGTAMASSASIFLFDEPTSNLSTDAVDEIRDVLHQLKRDGGTILVAEHRVCFLKDLVDNVLTMADGKVQRVWEARDFYALSDSERKQLGLRTLSPPELTLPTPATEEPNPNSGMTLRNVRFSYSQRQILDLPEINFPQGKVTALLGPNGVGKTTLCRIITGLLKPDKGSQVLWQGKETTAKQRLAMSTLVMQDVHRQLFADSVSQEVTTGTKTRPGINAAQVLAQLDLQDLADRHPMSLSGGQKQRLMIASSVADSAQVVVLDEPTSGVDYRHLKQITERVHALAATGAAVVVVSHDLEFVTECADQVVVLENPQDALAAAPQ